MKNKHYYIRAYFGKWHEVDKEFAEEFIRNFYNQTNGKKTFEEFKALHYKEVEEDESRR